MLLEVDGLLAKGVIELSTGGTGFYSKNARQTLVYEYFMLHTYS